MKVLVINCGSISLKYQLINMTDESVIAKGYVQRIGMEDSFIEHKKAGGKIEIDYCYISDHNVAFKEVVKILIEKDMVVKNLDEINAVGHRIVHGGENFKEAAIITDYVIDEIEACNDLAPLHNPAHLLGIRAAIKALPGIPMVAVFDTAFHQTMPKQSYMYALPYELYEKYKIRRYGFHGTSHKYIVQRLAELNGKKVEEINAITCHLGNGGSICAIKDGKSFDTSMGFTPLEGLVMGSRCGDIDPAIVPYLMEKENMSPSEINDYMNKKCGLMGLCGFSDARDIQKARLAGDKKAQLAFDMYCYRIQKYIGAYIAALGGKVDYVAFSGGIGERNYPVRERIMEGLEGIGLILDKEINTPIHDLNMKECPITTKESKIEAWVILTDEELMIARETMELIKGGK